MKAIVLYTMQATSTVLLGNSWTMVQSFCSKKLQQLILDDTFFCLILVAVATYNEIINMIISTEFWHSGMILAVLHDRLQIQGNKLN